jgi:hypothetical protein
VYCVCHPSCYGLLLLTRSFRKASREVNECTGRHGRNKIHSNVITFHVYKPVQAARTPPSPIQVYMISPRRKSQHENRAVNAFGVDCQGTVHQVAPVTPVLVTQVAFLLRSNARLGRTPFHSIGHLCHDSLQRLLTASAGSGRRQRPYETLAISRHFCNQPSSERAPLQSRNPEDDSGH